MPASARKVQRRAMKFVNGPIRIGHVTFGTDLALCGMAYDLCHGRLDRGGSRQVPSNTSTRRWMATCSRRRTVFHNAWYGYKNWGIGLACYAMLSRERARAGDPQGAGGGLRHAAPRPPWNWPATAAAGPRATTSITGSTSGSSSARWPGAARAWITTPLAPKFYRHRALASMFETYPGHRRIQLAPLRADGRRRRPDLRRRPRQDALAPGASWSTASATIRAHQAVARFQRNHAPLRRGHTTPTRISSGATPSVPKGDLQADSALSLASRGPGFVYARSSWDEDATYFFFKCGDRFTAHQHLDVDHFVIYKHAELAGDGGHYDEFGSAHDVNYHLRTIAHSTLLVLDPAGALAGHPRRRRSPRNDGGQHHTWQHHNGAASDPADWLKQKDATATSPTCWRSRSAASYLYVAGDATRAYSPNKLSLFTRQIVFLRPDTFVIFDRVTSTRPEFKKTWLLQAMTHAGARSGRALVITNGKGRLFVQTLLPKDARVAAGLGRGPVPDRRTRPTRRAAIPAPHRSAASKSPPRRRPPRISFSTCSPPRTPRPPQFRWQRCRSQPGALPVKASRLRVPPTCDGSGWLWGRRKYASGQMRLRGSSRWAASVICSAHRSKKGALQRLVN